MLYGISCTKGAVLKNDIILRSVVSFEIVAVFVSIDVFHFLLIQSLNCFALP